MIRVLFVVLTLTLLATQYKLWFGEGSIMHLTQLEKKLAAQEALNKKLIIRNRVIEADILELKSGQQALEEQARYGLGMIKEGEQFYQFIE